MGYIILSYGLYNLELTTIQSIDRIYIGAALVNKIDISMLK